MADITCEIIKDLLPLYVDGSLSEDSRKLVKEHIDSCDECRKDHERLMAPDIMTNRQKAADDKEVFRKILRRIRAKNVIIALATAAAGIALGLCILYFAAIKAYPVPYEKSRVYVEDNVLKSTLFYREAYILPAPDLKTAFTFLTAAKTNLSGPDITVIEHIDIMDLEKIEPAKQLDKNGNVVAELEGPTVLYYVPPEYAKKLADDSYWASYWENGDEAEMQRKLDELISASTLIWTAD